MKIDGSHLTNMYLNPATPAKASGNSGIGALLPKADRHEGVSATFAEEIARRTEGVLDENGEPRDSAGLVAGLTDAMEYIRSQHGDDAATAAMGMVLQGTSSGVSEDSLGDSMVNVLKMIDRNFGIASGDAAIGRFNGSLNAGINDYFQNGLDEKFMVAGAAPGAGADQTTIMADLTARATSDATTPEVQSPMEALLASIKADLDEKTTESLEEQLDEVQEEQLLESAAKQASGTATVSAQAVPAPQGMAAYADAAAGGSYDSGPSLLSMSI